MINALVEGRLDGEVLRRLCADIGLPTGELVIRDARGSPFWSDAKRYNQAARHQTVLGLADLENKPCAQAALEALGESRAPRFCLRLAVRMVESWLMADKEALSAYLSVPERSLPDRPDEVDHPKRHLVALASRSRKRAIRDGVGTPAAGAIVGPLYVPAMREFVRNAWRPARARQSSPSLERAYTRYADAIAQRLR